MVKMEESIGESFRFRKYFAGAYKQLILFDDWKDYDDLEEKEQREIDNILFNCEDDEKTYLEKVKTLVDDEGKFNRIKSLAEEFIRLKDKKDHQEQIKKNPELKSKKESLRGVLVNNYLENANKIHEITPYIYDDSKIFWFWNRKCCKYEIKEETDIMNIIEDELEFMGQTINPTIKNQYLEALKRVGRRNKVPQAKIKWVQFKDKAFSINSNKIYLVTPDYFFTNPISYEMSNSSETPTMNKLFEEWVGKKYVKTLYEIIAYCCYRDMPIQTIFCFFGSGRNGKSQFMKILNKFIGKDNICSTELDLLLDSRFEAFKLYKKLACSLGETNFGVLKKTSLLKKLVGGDLIGYEKKGKDPFDEYNYAKIIISSNSLPSTDDTSDGFWRRWLIIDFPNTFAEGTDIVATIPEHEYNNLAKKVTEILPTLLKNGCFTNQGTIEERKEKYILSSNPLPIFIKQFCMVGEEEFVSYSKFYMEYTKYLLKNKKRKVKMGEFKGSLENEGFWVEKSSKKINDEEWKNTNWVIGINIKPFWDNYDICDPFSTSVPYESSKEKNTSQKSQMSQKVVEESLEE